jgi:hypothetical protein
VRVELDGNTGARSLHRVIGGTSSFGDNPLVQTIGLGRAESIPAVEITWPGSGKRQTVRGLPLDRAVEITEAQGGFRLLNWTKLPPPRQPD